MNGEEGTAVESAGEGTDTGSESAQSENSARTKTVEMYQSRLPLAADSTGRRHTSEVSARKRNRQSMTVTSEMIEGSELSAVIKQKSPRPTYAFKVVDSVPEVAVDSPRSPRSTGTPPLINSARSDSSSNDGIANARRPSRAVTVDPQDLNAQLALEQTSRTLRADTSLEEMEAEFMQRILPHVPKNVARTAVALGETCVLSIIDEFIFSLPQAQICLIASQGDGLRQ